MDDLGLNNEALDTKTKGELEASMSEEEVRIMHQIRARQMIRTEDTVNLDTFSVDTINGLTVNLEQGSLGLVKPSAGKKSQELDAVGMWHGEGGKVPAGDKPMGDAVATQA
jgi:hypothetical protein